MMSMFFWCKNFDSLEQPVTDTSIYIARFVDRFLLYQVVSVWSCTHVASTWFIVTFVRRYHDPSARG